MIRAPHPQRFLAPLAVAALVLLTACASRNDLPRFDQPRADIAAFRTRFMPSFEPGKKVATRQAWGACLNLFKDALPTLIGGSADLDPSNQTAKFRDAVGIFGAENPTGRNLSFGVREFPMKFSAVKYD